VLQALIVVAGIALADSLNPATIGAGVLMAMSERPTRRVLEFTAGAFLANVLGGALLVLGPGHWLFTLLPSPSRHWRHVAEVIGGVVLLVAAIVVWALRERLGRRHLPGSRVQGGHAFTAGASLMLIELPTAFPYFAAIAAIVGLDAATGVQLGLVCLFNVIFLAPLLAIATIVRFSPRVRDSVIGPASIWINRHWPLVFAVVMAVIGAVLLATGSAGLARA
jgi:cytochrome c biogenesis protein CcdA